MPERQPSRPTEEDFIGAAVRFFKDDYEITRVYVPTHIYTNVYTVPSRKPNDVDIIRREQDAEGKRSEYESVGDFALRQLSFYQQAGKL